MSIRGHLHAACPREVEYVHAQFLYHVILDNEISAYYHMHRGYDIKWNLCTLHAHVNTQSPETHCALSPLHHRAWYSSDDSLSEAASSALSHAHGVPLHGTCVYVYAVLWTHMYRYKYYTCTGSLAGQTLSGKESGLWDYVQVLLSYVQDVSYHFTVDYSCTGTGTCTCMLMALCVLFFWVAFLPFLLLRKLVLYTIYMYNSAHKHTHIHVCIYIICWKLLSNCMY